MYWTEELFHVKKPIIAMCHLRALPGDPYYDKGNGMKAVVEQARAELRALQDGGVDAVMFSNEFSLPYLTDVKDITVASMARVIGELMDGSLRRECAVGPEKVARPCHGGGCELRARDLYRPLCQRFRPLEHQLR